MRRLLQLLFIGLYLLSGYATAQSRIDDIQSKLEHSNGAVSFSDACKDKVHYTQFREAKRVTTDLILRVPHDALHGPATGRRDFLKRNDSVRPHNEIDISDSRAPPESA